MLLAEELALIAIDEESGRHAFGIRDRLNACLAGLLIAELLLDGHVAPTDAKGTVALTDAPVSKAPLLRAAAEVVAEKGPKIKAVLSHMSRGLDQRIGSGTWDAVAEGLVTAGVLRPSTGGLAPRHHLADSAVRDEIVDRLRRAAAANDAMDARTALVLSMTGPANLLELVAPERKGRKHARARIDHALDASNLQPIGDVVRRVLAEAAAAASAAAVAATVAAASST